MSEPDRKLVVAFDSNAFDKLVDLTPEQVDNLIKKVNICSTTVQMQEFSKIKEFRPEKYKIINSILNGIPSKNLNHTVFGFAESGYAGGFCYPFASDEQIDYMIKIRDVMNSYQNKKKVHNKRNNGADSFLAMIGIFLTVITNDKALYRAIKESNHKVMTFEELIEFIR